MTTLYKKWTLTTGTLLVFSPVYLIATDPMPVAAEETAEVQNAPPVQQLPPPTPVAPSVFTPALPPVPAPASGVETAPSPKVLPGTRSGVAAPAAVSVGRPASAWMRCKLQMQDCFLGYPEYFRAPPLGNSLTLHFRAQVANGEAARMVLYQYDFFGDQLSLRGKDRLAEIVAMLPTNACPIVVERTPANPQLAEARRQAVLNELAQAPFPVPAERVLIGPSLANGLAGREAVLIYLNLLSQTAGRGPAIFGGSGAGGGVRSSIGGIGQGQP